MAKLIPAASQSEAAGINSQTPSWRLGYDLRRLRSVSRLLIKNKLFDKLI